MELPTCECCPRITEPGSGTLLPFLQGAEKRLKKDLLDEDEDVFDLTKTLFVPPTFEVDSQETEGYKAEYEVFYALKELEKESSIKFFVFHSADSLRWEWGRNQASIRKLSTELADFIIFTSFAIIAIEVKAIKPNKAGSPVVRYKKAREQLEMCCNRLKTYIQDHLDANNEDIPVHTFVCLPNMDSDVLENKNLEGDWIAGSQSKDTRRHKLATGILEKMENLKTKSTSNERHPAIRIALYWLYGSRTHFGSYPTLYGAAKHIEYKLLQLCGKRYCGVPLTDERGHLAQLEGERLAIRGDAGTGENLCLFSQMAFILETIQSNSLIVFIHASRGTSNYVKELFKTEIGNYDGEKYKFLALEKIDEETTAKLLLKNIYLFLDDVTSLRAEKTFFGVQKNILKLIDKSLSKWVAVSTVSTSYCGVLLTGEQRQIAEREDKRLVIKGDAGTGKTFCLVSKMASIWETIQSDSMIVFIHASPGTSSYVKDLFKTAIGQKDDHDRETYEFLSLKQIDEAKTVELLLKNVYLFLDDVTSMRARKTYFDVQKNILKLIDKSHSVWMAGSNIFSDPYIELMDVEFSESLFQMQAGTVILTRIMRSSCHIIQFGFLMANSGIVQTRYAKIPGHYRVGEKPTVEIYSDDKEREIISRKLSHLIREGFLKHQLAVLYVEKTKAMEELEKEFAEKALFENHVDFIGRECRCVILVLNGSSTPASRLEATQRSISKLILFIAKSQDRDFAREAQNIPREANELDAPSIARERINFTHELNKFNTVHALPLSDHPLSILDDTHVDEGGLVQILRRTHLTSAECKDPCNLTCIKHRMNIAVSQKIILEKTAKKWEEDFLTIRQLLEVSHVGSEGQLKELIKADNVVQWKIDKCSLSINSGKSAILRCLKDLHESVIHFTNVRSTLFSTTLLERSRDYAVRNEILFDASLTEVENMRRLCVWGTGMEVSNILRKVLEDIKQVNFPSDEKKEIEDAVESICKLILQHRIQIRVAAQCTRQAVCL